MTGIRQASGLFAACMVHGCASEPCPTAPVEVAPPPPAAQRPYRLPFAAGQQIIVGQGNFGVFGLGSHTCQYAIDFVMPVGTPILAARGGKVVGVVEDCPNVNCPLTPESCCGNYVEIEHADGTRAIYYHLVQFGACVAVGAVVEQGDVIARAGNTGYSISPHLHFAVYAAGGAAGGGSLGLSDDGSLEAHFAEVAGDGVPRTLQYVISENASAHDWCR